MTFGRNLTEPNPPAPAQLLPWHLGIRAEDIPATSINSWTCGDFATGASPSNFANGGTGLRTATSPVQNDEIAWDLILNAGTWEITLYHRKSTNVGIYTVSFDGVSAGTIDGYAASPIEGLDTISSINIPASGKVRVKFKMATKNGSSSGYTGTIFYVSLRRTA